MKDSLNEVESIKISPASFLRTGDGDLMQLLIKHTPAAVAMFDINLCYLAHSDRWITDYKVEDKNIIGKSHYEVFPDIPLNYKHWMDDHKECLKGKIIKCDRDKFIRPDGKTEWLKYEIHPWRDSQNEIGGIIMFTEVITKQIENEIKLQTANQLSKFVIDSSDMMIITTDADAVITSFNKSAEDKLGYDAKEVIGKTTPMTFHLRSEMDAVKTKLKKDYDLECKNDLDIFKFILYLGKNDTQWTYVRKDGSKFSVVLHLDKLLDEAGKVIGFTGMIRDDSEIKQKERDLKLILDHVPSLIFYKDVSNRILRVNKLVAETLDMKESEFEGKDCAEIYPAELATKYYRDDLEVMQKGEPKLNIIEHHMKADGTKQWVRTDKVPIKNDAGEIESILVLATDITDQKHAEKQISKLSKFFDLSLDLSCLVNFDHQFEYLNHSWSEILGYSEEEFKAKPFTEFIHEDDKEKSINEFSEMITKNKKVRDFENRFISKNGDIKHLMWNAEAIENQKLIYAIARDITKIKETEKNLLETTDNLKRSNAELENFAYLASHDLQEPLRTVSSYVGLFANKFFDNSLDKETAQKYITYITNSSTRMRQLINDLLSYSRVARNNSFEFTSLGKILNTVTLNLNQAIDESKANIIIPNQLPKIYGIETELIQLFQNLISNAIKYRKENTIPEIEINFKENSKEWLFNIKDNGIGIDSEYFEKIFIIFQRLHNNSKYKGTGIGLSLCKKIVDHHKGKIWVESYLGSGSTFFFTISKSNEEESNTN